MTPADLPRLENPETGVRHAVDHGHTTICGVTNEDFELSFDGEWDDDLCKRCTQRITAGFDALLKEVLG
jgi:hypothetical protein